MTSASGWSIDDEQRRLDECVQEPIRAPGTIQPHGALLAVQPHTLDIVFVSENCDEILGTSARSLLGRPLGDFTGQTWAADNLGEMPVGNPIPFERDLRRFETIVHRDGPLHIVEFEPLDSRAGRAEAPDRSAVAVYGAMHRLARVRSPRALWADAARELRDLTGFERVTIYSFHPDGHGEIVAEELVDGMEPYLGLHFPASDIPEQARQLYLTKLSRQIADNSGATSALVTLPGGDAQSLDLGSAELRSVSPHHLQFMRNMGQASTLSLSLVREGELIGMITLAHRTPHRVTYLLRQGLEVLANQIALQLNSMDEIDRLRAEVEVRRIRATLIDQPGVRASTDTAELATALFSGDLTVLNLVPADGAVLSLAGTRTTVGTVPSDEAIIDLDDWALGRGIDKSYVSESLSVDDPDLAARLTGVAGILLVPLPGSGDFIAWFRAEITDSVSWLGDQSRENRVTPLSPRTSFSSWTQSVTGRCAPWNGLEREAEELSRDLAGVMVRHAEARLAALAMRDALTGLPNRRLLMNRLNRALSAPARETTLLFIDLDSFKQINDVYGHEAGDRVLRHTSQRILDRTRASDTVARLGGDEFVVLCEGTNRTEAAAMARRVIDAIRQPIMIDGTPLIVTASVGIADADPAATAEDLLRGADVAMYRAKKSGRNRVSR